ncbi:Cytochrome p450 [Thalictrum thalictroides]|uniref:Cytochrome p450 n=1 Tax=Thalictrum thalictroides TaxID=46969 RepID=A0A7J6VVX1_THATH|nr:Cytochrome p450 [Thalictrum thalictroides]
MEWAMSLLLNHPEVLNKARDEIEQNVGCHRLLDESDLVKLPYLHCIISETLRVCPVGAFLPPHESSEDCTIGGYNVPKGTMLLVNQQALYKDPKVWAEPTMFKPERFEKSTGENDGTKWIGFGQGRRGCPGEVLAYRMLGLTLGLLIQCFDWERVGGEMVDMTTGDRRLMTKAKPLEAMYRPRKVLLNVFCSFVVQ